MTENTPPASGQLQGQQQETDAAPRDKVSRWTMAAVVAFFVLAGHIWSIPSGLWLDDHAHFNHLRELDWSFASAVDSARLGIVGEVMDLWGQRESGLRFFRPIAFWIMKLEYTVADWRPLIMHLFSLGWHFCCAMLVGALAMRCLGRRFWATVAASLMALHPAHTVTVYWIACQTEVLTTAFLLLATLAYSRHAGWGDRWFVRKPNPEADGDRKPASQNPLTLAGIVSIICYALALGCRENALLFPVICWAGDWLCGPSGRRRWLRWEYMALAGVIVVYFILRTVMLGGFPIPARPYLMPISDPEFPIYIIEKAVIYTLALFAFIPLVPFGGRVFFSTRMGMFYGGFAAIVALLLVIWAVYRFRRTLLWPVVWIVCLIAPMLPVFASGHHLYLPSVGMCLLIAAGLAALGGVLKPANNSPGIIRKYASRLLLTVLTLGLGLMTWCSGFAYTRGTLVEDILVENVINQGQPIQSGDHLFFINIPAVAYYVIPAIKTELSIEELHGHALTFSPDMVGMRSPGKVEILDAHRIRIRSPEHERYFEGITGKCILQMLGVDTKLKQNEPFDAELFTAVPTAIDEKGIRELEFTFKEPIDSPNYHFYFGSPRFLAYPLDVSAPTSSSQEPNSNG